jgi:hypothetical protein
MIKRRRPRLDLAADDALSPLREEPAIAERADAAHGSDR